MPRTTLDLDATVLRELRLRSEQDGKSMGQVASEALASALSRSADRTAAPTFDWSTADLGAPLVDLEDDEAVMRVLDGRG